MSRAAPNSPDDRTLVRRHVAGDPAAFDQIMQRYQRRIWAVCLRMVADRDDALDATQETFVTAYRALGGFRGDAQLTTWLHRIAINASLDLLRKRERRRGEPVDEMPDRSDAGPGPEERAISSQRSEEVHTAVAKLPLSYRAVVVLHDLQGLGYPEIAEVLDIPLGTVKSRLHRARLELAGMLGHLREKAEPSSTDGTLR